MSKQIAFIDVETTGISSKNNEIIELGIMLGEYDKNQIIRVVDEYSEFQEPFFSIPKNITNITGITNDMVYGKALDLEKIFSMLQQADSIVAHNVSFDRGFVSKLLPEVVEFDWYCSVRQIKWKEFGFHNGKLQQLLKAHHIDVRYSHRALDDAKNLAWLLNFSNSNLGEEETFISYLMSKNPTKKPMSNRR